MPIKKSFVLAFVFAGVSLTSFASNGVDFSNDSDRYAARFEQATHLPSDRRALDKSMAETTYAARIQPVKRLISSNAVREYLGQVARSGRPPLLKPD